MCDKDADSGDFIEFLLEALNDTLNKFQDYYEFGDEPLSGIELMNLIGIKHRPTFRKNFVAQMNEKGFNFDEDELLRKVTEFFTGIMSTIIFSLFRLRWSEYNGLLIEEVDSLFKKPMR